MPYVLFLVVLPFVNRVTPTVLGLPFLFFWMLLATLLTPVSVWLARRGDRRRGHGRADAPSGAARERHRLHHDLRRVHGADRRPGSARGPRPARWKRLRGGPRRVVGGRAQPGHRLHLGADGR
ncbi:DUF3311 domain-containing protein [Streptomyces albulus]|nr:DUF3311 domain-containing protein [Streptomyces noursei]